MRKTLLLTAVLALSAAWLPAQEGHPGKDSQVGASSGQQGTIQGCLQRTGAYYTVRDQHGIMHRLGGDTAKLRDYVGHEVQITGTFSTRATDTTQQGAASTTTERPDFKVQDVKDISGSCTNR
jgi:hypothetical protein